MKTMVMMRQYLLLCLVKLVRVVACRQQSVISWLGLCEQCCMSGGVWAGRARGVWECWP